MRYRTRAVAAVLSITVASTSLVMGAQHTLGELFAGATLTAGGLTFSNFHYEIAPPPKFGMNNQDIDQIVIAVTSDGGPAVRLSWDSTGVLNTQGREEIDFVLRYTVSAQDGYVALAKTQLVSFNFTSPNFFSASSPFLSIEQAVFVAGTLQALAFLDVGPHQLVNLDITFPVPVVDVATHIVLTGEQNDDNPAEYDYVKLHTLDQTFWRAARVLNVNSVADAPDGNIGDGIADTGTKNSPTGITTFRAALNEADGTPDLDVIHFEIPGDGVPAIQPRSHLFGGLGALWPVIVDGYVQEAGWIELDGSTSTPPPGGLPTVGFELVGQFSAVRGLVINRFQSHGIQLRQSGAPFKGNNIIFGNQIGTDSTGVQNLGNSGDGIRIVEQPDNTIGGIQENLIVNNGGNGVSILGAQSVANTVHGNVITKNQGAGVLIAQGAGARISQGAPTVVFGNAIAGNGGAGVRLDPTAGVGNEIISNSISANGGLGIDAGPPGPTPDGVPVLTKVISSAGGATLIDGSLQGKPMENYLLEFFVNAIGDPSTFGEGEKFLGSGLLATDASGKDQRNGEMNHPGFPFVFAGGVPAGHVVTATATITFGSTSEFSQWKPAIGNAFPNANAGVEQTVTPGAKVTLDGTASNDPDNGPGPLTFLWEQLDGPEVKLNNPMSATPDFTPMQEGVHTFILTVCDGLNCDEDEISITVTSGTSNKPPTATATATANATVRQNVVLDGSASSDPDNGPSPLAYTWTQLSGPIVALTGANTATANFTPEVPGSYGFQLLVSDGMASDQDAITVVVSGAVENAINLLIITVQTLAIDAKSKEKLLGKLESALASLRRGNINAAKGQVGAFLHNVKALEHSGNLPAGTAQALVAAAEAIIASLDKPSR